MELDKQFVIDELKKEGNNEKVQQALQIARHDRP